MLKAALLLLVLTNAAWRERVIWVEVLEANHWGAGGSVQLIAWRSVRGCPDYPTDWTVSPSGKRSGEFWFDANGTVIKAGEFRESWTEKDVEREAYQWHRRYGTAWAQEGIWHETQTPVTTP